MNHELEKRILELKIAYAEYISFLEKDIAENAPFLYVHGVRTSKEDAKKGENFRQRIEVLSKIKSQK